MEKRDETDSMKDAFFLGSWISKDEGTQVEVTLAEENGVKCFKASHKLPDDYYEEYWILKKPEQLKTSAVKMVRDGNFPVVLREERGEIRIEKYWPREYVPYYQVLLMPKISMG